MQNKRSHIQRFWGNEMKRLFEFSPFWRTRKREIDTHSDCSEIASDWAKVGGDIRESLGGLLFQYRNSVKFSDTISDTEIINYFCKHVEGGEDTILKMVEKEQRHRQGMEKVKNKFVAFETIIDRCIFLGIVVGVLTVGVLLIVKGYTFMGAVHLVFSPVLIFVALRFWMFIAVNYLKITVK